MPYRAWNSMATFILMFINTHQSCVTVLVEQFIILTTLTSMPTRYVNFLSFWTLG